MSSFSVYLNGLVDCFGFCFKMLIRGILKGKGHDLIFEHVHYTHILPLLKLFIVDIVFMSVAFQIFTTANILYNVNPC